MPPPDVFRIAPCTFAGQRKMDGDREWFFLDTAEYIATRQTPVPVTFSELTRFCREGLYSELRDAIYYEKDISTQLNSRTQRGNTLLHEAAEHDHPDIVQLLLLHGCPPDLRSKGGLTPLHVASVKGHVGCVRALLENNADVTLRDDVGQTAFTKAERSKKKVAVQALLASKGSVTIKPLALGV